MTFRFATADDCGQILVFIQLLADHEHMSDQVVATEQRRSFKELGRK